MGYPLDVTGYSFMVTEYHLRLHLNVGWLLKQRSDIRNREQESIDDYRAIVEITGLPMYLKGIMH